MKLRPLTSYSALHEGIACWNRAFSGVGFDRRVADQRLFMPAPGVTVEVWGGYEEGGLEAILVTKRLEELRAGYDKPVGWISLLAADPDHGTLRATLEELLEHALGRFEARGITDVRFGGDLRKFIPGLPSDAPTAYEAALEATGFGRRGTLSDLYCRLDAGGVDTVVEAYALTPEDVTVRAGRTGDEPSLREFVQQSFPGRWAFQIESNCRLPGAIGDYWLVFKGERLVAFARTGDMESTVVSACANWRDRWGPDYCGLGPIGVCEAHRGNGYGLALIATVMHAYWEAGHRHMTIDGVADGLLNYYARLGFEPELAFEKYTIGL